MMIISYITMYIYNYITVSIDINLKIHVHVAQTPDAKWPSEVLQQHIAGGGWQPVLVLAISAETYGK